MRRDHPTVVSAEVAAEMGYRLDFIDQRLNTPQFKKRLLVNQKGRVKPKHPLIPSQQEVRFCTGHGWDDRDPQGANPRVHKKSYKAKK